jgi:hypothetical protein
MSNLEFDLDIDLIKQIDNYLIECNECNEVLNKFKISKNNKYTINEIYKILNFLYLYEKITKYWFYHIKIFKKILKSDPSINHEDLNKLYDCLKNQSKNVNYVNDLIIYFEEKFDIENTIISMCYENRENLSIYYIDTSTTNDLIFDDHDIIYLANPYDEYPYEYDMLLEFIDNNIAKVESNNDKIMNTDKKFIELYGLI